MKSILLFLTLATAAFSATGDYILQKKTASGYEQKLVTPESGKVLSWDGSGNPVNITPITSLTWDAITGKPSFGSAATLDASASGGANKLLQMDASGNIYTGPLDNRVFDGGVLGNAGSPGDAGAGYLRSGFGAIGNIYIPDQQGLIWRDPANGATIFSIRGWRGHDGLGGEPIFEFAWRSAWLSQGPNQIGHNDALPTAQGIHLVSGASSVNDTIKHSRPISWQSKRYNGGGTEQAGYVTAQAISLTDNTNSTVLRFAIAENPADGPWDGFNGGGGTYTKGLSVGTDMAEFSAGGIWHTGRSPAFESLSYASTITQTCSKYKEVQQAKFTLTGPATLAISGAVNGMRGVLLVTQDGTGSRVLSLPSNAKSVSGFALSTAPSVTDQLEWYYDGSYYFFSVVAAAMQVPLDSDASAFIARASITDDTQEAAINDLVVSLKAASLWTKGRAIYPFVGGNATAHSKNLKADSYNITWAGTVTHNSSGITGNDTNGYGTTGFDFATDGHATEASLYVYCRTAASTINKDWIGAINSGSSNRAGLGNAGNSVALMGINSNTLGSSGIAVASNFSRHIAGNRSGSSAQELYADATQATNTEAVTSRCNNDIYILARNANGAADRFTNANLAFAWIGDSLTSTEWATFRGIIDTFQAALSRTKP